MNEEKRLANDAAKEIRSTSNEANVSRIINRYLINVRAAGLIENAFINYLSQSLGLIGEAQTPDQTLKNTMAALAILQGGKK